ncbi:hypothetical protein ACLMJK_003108 [Lecanora helva]
MTHRKQKTHQQKRQQFTDDSGWTHVVKGPKGSINNSTKPSSNQVQDDSTVEKLAEALKSKYMPIWLESECLRRLIKLFEQSILTEAHVAITNCVCLGLGSFLTGHPTTFYELAALKSILDILGERHRIQQVIFQDPAFSDLDKSFLRSLGYVVVEDPQAFSTIDENTFVFAPHLEVAQTAISLENRKPTLFVGNDLSNYVNG